MCAINGIFAYHYAANPVSPDELRRTREHMAQRGPDGIGEWFSEDGRIGFGHRRLSIIDLSDAGRQPMHSADGTLSVAFNGEIYNYRELRRMLTQHGCRFATESDTEVLLHLYAIKGTEMLLDLRGMFAFAIFDRARDRLLLGRDRFGIKPLYYSDDGWTFRFASQVKALMAGGGISPEIEPAAVVGFHLFGSVPEPFTTHRAIRALPAGATLTVDRIGAGKPARYHAIATAYARPRVSRPDRHQIEARVRAALLDSVRAHLVADVPVGAFLSAGIDSGALVGLMRDAGASSIETVTVGFQEFAGRPDDETAQAASIARHYGTNHTTRIVTRAEFESDLPRIFAAMDQPTIDGINTWFVAKAARERGLKVAISGLGGDEVLGGYPSFRDIPRFSTALRVPAMVPGLGWLWRTISGGLAGPLGLNPKVAGLVDFGGTVAGRYLLRRALYLPSELTGILAPETLREGMRRVAPLAQLEAALQPRPVTDFGRIATLETAIYMRNQLLRDTDWASMAHSLEVRVPLVDHVLLDELASFGGDFSGCPAKLLLADAPTSPLPPEIRRRPKTGFTTPVSEWTMATTSDDRGKVRSIPWARRWSAVVAQKFNLA